MLLKPLGMVGFLFIVGAMIAKSLGWTSDVKVIGAIAFVGLICFGIVESKLGRRHWMVKYIDYAPLVVFGFLFAVQMRDSQPSLWYSLVIIPFSALSGWEANRLARTEKYRTMRRIEEMLPKQPQDEANKHHRY